MLPRPALTPRRPKRLLDILPPPSQLGLQRQQPLSLLAALRAEHVQLRTQPVAQRGDRAGFERALRHGQTAGEDVRRRLLNILSRL
jgi:hypothetical protein